MGPVTKALGALIAVNTQAAVLVMAGFWARDYLDTNWPQTFSWTYVVVPVILVAIGHSYYVMMRYLMKVDAEMRGKGSNKGEDG